MTHYLTFFNGQIQDQRFRKNHQWVNVNKFVAHSLHLIRKFNKAHFQTAVYIRLIKKVPLHFSERWYGKSWTNILANPICSSVLQLICGRVHPSHLSWDCSQSFLSHRKCQPTTVFLPGKSIWKVEPTGYSPSSHKECDSF